MSFWLARLSCYNKRMDTQSKSMQVSGRFQMHRGGFLESPTIAYETWGELEGNGDNAILLFGGLSPSAHAASSPENPAAGWWEDMIGSGLPLDTDRYFVICINSLGSCFGTTGPASIDPLTGERYRAAFSGAHARRCCRCRLRSSATSRCRKIMQP